MPGRVDVVVAPQFLGNPLQGRITAELETRGYTVRELKSRWELLRTVALAPPKVLHLHWLYPYIHGRTRPRSVGKSVVLVATVALARLRGVGVVWTTHNRIDHFQRWPRLDDAVHRVLGPMLDAAVVTDHAAVADHRRALGARPDVVVAPMGNNIDDYGDAVERSEARRRLGIPVDAKVVLAFGSIRRQKRIEMLVAAARDVGAWLVIAGHAKDRAHAAELADLVADDETVVLHERFIDDDEVATYFGAADVFAQIGENQNTSGSILVAAGFGRVVLAEPNDDGSTYADDDCVFMSMPDAASVAVGLRRALARAAEPGAGSANRQAVRSQTWSKHVDALESVYGLRRATPTGTASRPAAPDRVDGSRSARHVGRS